MENICEKKFCTGCGMCEAVCPTNSIKLQKNKNGFFYPHILEGCIQCKKCQKLCPSNIDYYEKTYCGAYMVWHKDKDVLLKSSSGGAFAALATVVLESKGYIIGCAYNDEWLAEHILISSKSDLIKLHKSKYMQSDFRNVYKLVDEYANGHPILITGTPCQIAGIKGFFNNNVPDNVFLCDLICHGVQSPHVYKEALNYLEKKYNSKTTYVDFRSKDRPWSKACNAIIKFQNGKKIKKRANDILIGIAFLRNYSLRDSCYNCKYKNISRVGDITIGDFWDIRNDKKFLKENGDYGYSTIICNNKKGLKLFNDSKKNLNVISKTIEQCKESNGPLFRQLPVDGKEKQFFIDFSNNGFDYVRKKYMRVNYSEALKRNFINFGRKLRLNVVYRNIKKIIGRF